VKLRLASGSFVTSWILVAGIGRQHLYKYIIREIPDIVVKGGVKPDHRGGVKVDQRRG
jgi:hypothetical protein